MHDNKWKRYDADEVSVQNYMVSEYSWLLYIRTFIYLCRG
ncbi:hypothetical protein HMPREF9445_01776 [Bacteroides clarus YIT 12056]|uniref:Uncharacterized protein n=1 Tax=Bacteroides clarus YIT 12056 TaxID=762984 RepID=A0ABN0CNZ0_9BACE|nr:hypothetical protein HMPREF9445_01776 [Bacteroides clarus YIT 12056]